MNKQVLIVEQDIFTALALQTQFQIFALECDITYGASEAV